MAEIQYLHAVLLLAVYWRRFPYDKKIPESLDALTRRLSKPVAAFCDYHPDVLADPVAHTPTLRSDKADAAALLNQYLMICGDVPLYLRRNITRLKEVEIELVSLLHTFLKERSNKSWHKAIDYLWSLQDIETVPKELKQYCVLEPKLQENIAAHKKQVRRNKALVAQATRLTRKISGLKGAWFIPSYVSYKADHHLLPEYQHLQKLIRKEAHVLVVDAVRAAGQPVSLGDAKELLEAAGIPKSVYPSGLDCLIGCYGELVTTCGRTIVHSLGKPVHWLSRDASVEINPFFNPVQKGQMWYMKVLTADGLETRFYTAEHKDETKNAKFNAVSRLSKESTKIKALWRKDLMNQSNGVTETTLHAALCEVLYQTAARTGSAGKAGTNFGIATLKRSHVRAVKDGISISYTGKAGIQHKHRLINNHSAVMNRLLFIIRRCCDRKGTDDNLWSVGNIEVNPQGLRRYFLHLLKHVGAEGASLHKIRHMKGTALAQRLLAKQARELNRLRLPDCSFKECAIAFKEALSEVGRLLGHCSKNKKTSWRTAANYYVDPVVMQEFWDSVRYEPPRGMIPK